MYYDKSISIKILRILRDYYNQDLDRMVRAKDIVDQLGQKISQLGVVDYLKQFAKDSLIFLELEGNSNYSARINHVGLEELIKLEKEDAKELSNNYDETSLDLDIQYEDFKGIMTVFVSHKFIKTDQNLALILQDKLKEYKISGHLAERKKPYDSLVRDKIMKSIQNSDYLIAIITKEASRSASLNQEIGYALGCKVPVIIMREKNVDHGVLTYGLQDEEFTRENFEKPCENVIQYIIKIGKGDKISNPDKKLLKEQVYEPCYNMMKNVYNDRRYLQNVPPNPWDSLTHALKLKTEPEMKILFEEYSKELGKWQTLFVERETSFFNQKKELLEILIQPFEKVGLIVNGNINQGKSQITLESWFDLFRFVLFEPSIRDATTLYEKLLDFATNKIRWYGKNLKEWNDKTDLFREMVKVLPQMRESLNTTVSYEELTSQHQILVSIIEKLTNALEEKVKENIEF